MTTWLVHELRRMYAAIGDIGDVGLLASGYEADVYAFTVRTNTGDEDLVARVFRQRDPERVGKEFATMDHLWTQGYQVPRPAMIRASSDDHSRNFLVMERICGRPLGEHYWGTDEPARQSARGILFSLMAQLHQLDASSLFHTPASPERYLERELAGLQTRLESLEGPAAASLSIAVRWLRQHQHDVDCDRLVLVHGDFHYNNVLISDDRRQVVIDWSNARLADPRQDLAWLAVVTTGDRDVSIYEQVTGHRVIDLDFFEAIASVRLLADVVAFTLPAASGQPPEVASRMRAGSDHTQHIATRLQEIVSVPMPELAAALDELLRSLTPAE